MKLKKKKKKMAFRLMNGLKKLSVELWNPIADRWEHFLNEFKKIFDYLFRIKSAWKKSFYDYVDFE